MRKEIIDWLIAQHEGQYIEFKSSNSDSFGWVICTFTNTRVCTIFIGIVLTSKLKPEDFGRKSESWNRLITEMFQRLSERERVVSGIRKMEDTVNGFGLRQPKFEFTMFFNITFWRSSESKDPLETSFVNPLVMDLLKPYVNRISWLKMLLFIDGLLVQRKKVIIMLDNYYFEESIIEYDCELLGEVNA